MNTEKDLAADKPNLVMRLTCSALVAAAGAAALWMVRLLFSYEELFENLVEGGVWVAPPVPRLLMQNQKPLAALIALLLGGVFCFIWRNRKANSILMLSVAVAVLLIFLAVIIPWSVHGPLTVLIK